MRDLALAEKLGRLAEAAGEHLRALTALGKEVPFEVTGPREGSPFAQYTPMTARFVRDNAAALAKLDAFAEACAAIAHGALAGPYLERLGEPVPDGEDSRARAAALAFVARAWEGCSDFSLEGDRLASALRELESCAESEKPEAALVAPLIGFQMPTTRLAVGDATLVRVDLLDVPEEIRRTEGTRRSPWEPQFLAVVRGIDPLADGSRESPDATAPGVALRELIGTLRLFKPGGVGLGPYAWARVPGDRWRPLPTGAARPRPGGYRLADTELADLSALCRAVARTGSVREKGGAGPASTLARAMSRFEAGLERPTLLDALSDYLLALRCLLEGGGAADVGLPMRVAALRADVHGRPAVKARVERALAQEGGLVRGEASSGLEGGASLELVAQIEEDARHILRGIASGRIARDARAVADEALVADGLASGEGAATLRGATAEWEAVKPDPAAEGPAPTPPEQGEMQGEIRKRDKQEIDSEQPTRVMVATKLNTERTVEPEIRVGRSDAVERTGEPEAAEGEPARAGRDWLSEVDSRGDTLEWPERPEALKLLDRRPAEREAARRRVSHLFPRPEVTDWRVAELQYERRRGRA